MRLFQVAWLLTFNLRRGRAFDFWEGVLLISEENILQTDFEGKKIYFARKYLQYSRFVCQEKKLLSPRSLGKEFLPKPNHPYPPSLKSQMVGPQSYAGVTPSTGHVSLWCETSLPWAVKTHNIYRFCCKKWRTTLYFLQQPDLLEDSFDSWVIKREIALFNSCWSNVAKSAK